MKDVIKIGYMIADEMEFIPVRKMLEERGAAKYEKLGREWYSVTVSGKDGRKIELVTTYCGIGKVNATMTATALVLDGAEILVSSGFSGGMADASGCVAVLGDRFVEHDFDMTVLGYAPSQKPGQDKWIYDGDKLLNAAYEKKFGKVLVGTLVTGDCFVSSEEKKDFCVNNFGAVACDMETAAEAAVADAAGARYIAIRFVSDDAGDDAGESYREVNNSTATTRFVGVAEWLLTLTEEDGLWR